MLLYGLPSSNEGRENIWLSGGLMFVVMVWNGHVIRVRQAADFQERWD